MLLYILYSLVHSKGITPTSYQPYMYLCMYIYAYVLDMHVRMRSVRHVQGRQDHVPFHTRARARDLDRRDVDMTWTTVDSVYI